MSRRSFGALPLQNTRYNSRRSAGTMSSHNNNTITSSSNTQQRKRSLEFSQEIMVDDIQAVQAPVQKKPAEPSDSETQTLLQMSHEAKAMKACISSLQQQVNRLEATFQGGDYEIPLEDDDIPRHIEEQAKSTVKSVSFDDASSVGEDGDTTRQDGAQSGELTSGEISKVTTGTVASRRTRGSMAGSRQSTVDSRVSTADKLFSPEHDTIDQHLSEDTFGFLLVTPTCSTPFGIALLILLFQVSIYTLMTTNLLNVDSTNLFSIPGNVPEPVWVAQVIAIVIAVVTQDDIRTGLDMLREGYTDDMREAFPHSNSWKFALSIITRLVEGSLGLVVNFLLIVTSETVIDLLLNFTALAFVSQLDEASFFLSKQGFAGRVCLEYSTLVSETHYAVPKTMVMARKTVMMIVILLAMLIAWGFVRFQQAEGSFLCSVVLVQMGDELRPELGTFSGLYELQNPETFGFVSKHVLYVEQATGNTRFGYCEAQQYWTLQYKDSPNATWPIDPCVNWKARSAETLTFEITTAARDLDWFVRDEFSREVALQPFFLHCFDCGNTFDVTSSTECGGRGTCSNAICTCDEGWYGLRCEFRAPCPHLTLDTRAEGTLVVSNDVAHHLGDGGFELLMDPRQDPPKMMEAYNRPIYVGHLLHGHHMIVLYTGRRWVTTHTGLLPGASFDTFASEEDGLNAVLDFFQNFHGHWSNYAIEFVSEPMDFGTPNDASQPVGLLWFEADPKSHINQTEIQAPNEARPSEVRLLCATCDNQYNPCHFDGVCVDGNCQCAVGAHGALCETSPVANGKCDDFYNIPYFEFDGGDCCDSTCVSTPEYTCGEQNSGYTNQGYPNCNLPPDRWQLLHDNRIEGDPLSLAGYSVSMSHAGTLLAVGEPEQSRVRLYDRDGSLWILRETLEGVPDSWLGISVTISGGPAHWRNNPNFRAPLVLAVEDNPDDAPNQIHIYSCGVHTSCTQKDSLTNVNGKKGPEAFDISSDGRVVAYGVADTGLLSVYELTGDYYEGKKVVRSVLNPDGVNATVGSAVWAVRLSEHGDVLAAFESRPSPAMNVLRVYEWDGEFYQPRGDAVLETHGDVLQRQLALSTDGSTVVVGLSECPNLDIMVFKWDPTEWSWVSRGSPPMRQEESCVGWYRAWSVETDHYGLTVVAVAYPDSDIVTAYEWIDTEGTWRHLGDPIDEHYPGSETSIALSADGAHVVVGVPYAGLMEAGLVSTYSLPKSHCPAGEAHHFRLSLTTDYDPQNILWGVEDVGSGELVLTGGPYHYQTATLVEEMCMDTATCHAFSIYNLKGAYGLERPGRFDLFVDGQDIDRDSFSGRAKRVSFGSGCLTCSEGQRLLRMMVHTCDSAEWRLVDSSGATLVAASTNKSCDDPDSIENFYWEEVCIEEAQCYSFTVTHIAAVPDEQSAAEEALLSYARSTNTSPPEQQTTGVEYLLLYDNDVHVASETGIVASATAVAGYCGL